MAHPIQTINPPEIIKRVDSLLAVMRITQLQQQPLGMQPSRSKRLSSRKVSRK